MIRAALLLLAAAGALVAPSVASAQSVAIDPTRRALAHELATLLNPEEPLMGAMDRAFGDSLPELMKADPQLKALEDEHPGILKVMADAMRPILLRYLRASIPELRDRIAVIYSDLSETHLRALIGFYRSPTGQRMIELMTSGIDTDAMMRTLIANDASETTAAELTGVTRNAASSAVGRMTPAQVREAGQFGMSPAGRALTALQPRIVAAMAEWSNNPSPAVQAEIEAAIIPVVQQYIQKRR